MAAKLALEDAESRPRRSAAREEPGDGEERLVEEEAEGREGGVLVGEAQEEELLDRELAIGDSSSATLRLGGRSGHRRAGARGRERGEPCSGRDLSAVYRLRRIKLDEGQKKTVEPFPSQRGLQRGEYLRERVRIDPFPEKAGDIVEYFVDQSHRVEASRANRPFGQYGRIDLFVYLPGQESCGAKVGENQIARGSKKRHVQAQPIPGLAGDVELHDSVAGARDQRSRSFDGLKSYNERLSDSDHGTSPGRGTP